MNSDFTDDLFTAITIIFKKEITIIKAILFVLLLLIFLLPASEDSTRNDQGRLLEKHREVSNSFKEDYISVLAISTVRTDNELDKEYPPEYSIPFLRELVISIYTFDYEVITIKDNKGNTKTTTRKIKKLYSRIVKRQEDLISFCLDYFNEKSEESLINNINYIRFLKLEENLPDEDLTIGVKEAVKEYELKRINPEDVAFKDEDKTQWYKFLFDEAIDNIYEDGTRRLVEAGIDEEDLIVSKEEYSKDGNSVIEFAKKYIGRPYLWGSKLGDTDSFDCSSYCWYIYKKTRNINLPRVSEDQYNNAKVKFSKNEINKLKQGDLVFFNTAFIRGRKITHVGIYIGNGKFINAQNKGVVIDDLNSYYWKSRFVAGGRY